MQNLSAITEQARHVLTDIRNGRGSLGKFLVDQEAYNHLNGSLENIDQMMADVEAGKGTLGQLVTNDDMYNRVNSVAGRVDNVLEAVQSKQGTLGKLVYDSGLPRQRENFHRQRQHISNGRARRERHARKTRDRRLAVYAIPAGWAKTCPARPRN